MTVSPSFTKRGEGAIEKKTGGGDFGPKITFFSLEENETAILRFCTDKEPVQVDGELAGGWLPVLQHDPISNLKPNPNPPVDPKDDHWPKWMGAVCRNALIFHGGYPDCFIDDNLVGQPQRAGRGVIRSAKEKYWTVACLREEVRDANGKFVARRDKMNTFTKKNEAGEEVEVSERALVLVSQANQNFYDKLAGMASIYGTLLDRDYHITRVGKELETDYQIVPLDPTLTADGKPFDLRDDTIMARYLPRAAEVGYARASDEWLTPIIEERSSDDFFARFFDTRVTVNVGADGTETVAPATAPVATPPTDAPAPVNVDDLVARLEGYEAPEAVSNGNGAPTPEPATAGAGAVNFD